MYICMHVYMHDNIVMVIQETESVKTFWKSVTPLPPPEPRNLLISLIEENIEPGKERMHLLSFTVYL